MITQIAICTGLLTGALFLCSTTARETATAGVAAGTYAIYEGATGNPREELQAKIALGELKAAKQKHDEAQAKLPLLDAAVRNLEAEAAKADEEARVILGKIHKAETKLSSTQGDALMVGGQAVTREAVHADLRRLRAALGQANAEAAQIRAEIDTGKKQKLNFLADLEAQSKELQRLARDTDRLRASGAFRAASRHMQAITTSVEALLGNTSTMERLGLARETDRHGDLPWDNEPGNGGEL